MAFPNTGVKWELLPDSANTDGFSLLMQRPCLLTVNRDSRRNVELLARRRSDTWPDCAEHCHIWCRSRQAFLEATTSLVSRTDIRPISSCMGRCSPERLPRDLTAVPIYVPPALCWLSGLGLRPPLLLCWGPDLMKSPDTAMAEDLVLTGKILTTEL